MLTFAVPKGRMQSTTLDYLRRIGVDLSGFDPDDRGLIYEDPDERFRLILAKPLDVTTYVSYGSAEVGVAGKDVIEETGSDLYEPLDLGFSECRLVVAAPEGDPPREEEHPRVATEFPNIAERHFARKGENVELVEVHGSVELTPLIGLAGRIVDIVSTGRTLRENGLVERETVLESSARLIVNRPAMKLHRDEVQRLIEDLRAEVEDDASN